MTEFLGSDAERLFVVLATWSIKWAVLIALLGVCLSWCRPRRPATRLLLCQCVLAGGMIIPLAPQLWGPRFTASALEMQGTEFPEKPEQIFAGTPNAPGLQTAIDPAEQSTIVGEPSRPLPPWSSSMSWAPAARIALSIWLIGVLLFLARLVVGWIWLARIRRTAQPAGIPALELLTRCRLEMSLSRPVPLLVHQRVPAPLITGILRPAIAVPACWNDLPEEMRRAALMHELAHLAHRDHWTKPFEEIVRAVFFFHPLVHWLLGRLDDEREQRCDAWAMHCGIPPRGLARTLVEFVKRQGHSGRVIASSQTLSFFNQTTVKARIEHLLEDDVMATCKPLSRARGVLLALAVFALAGGAGAFGLQAGMEQGATAPNQEQAKPAVAGLVLDENGAPVAGATVSLGRGGPKEKPLVAQSDADGRFRFAKLPATSERETVRFGLLAGKDGYAPTTGSFMIDYATSDSNDARNQNLQLKLTKAGTIGGVVSNRNGQPISGARVRLGFMDEQGSSTTSWYPFANLTLGTPLEAFYCARTDAQGNFQFKNAPLGIGLTFYVQAEGFADLDTMSAKFGGRYFPDKQSKPVNLAMDPEGRINGRVVTKLPGVKIKGLHLFLQSTNHANHSVASDGAITDDAGLFTFRGLPVGDFNVLMYDPPANAKWTVRMAPTVELRTAVVVDVTIELIEGIVVEGLVVQEGNGLPIEGAAVGAHGPGRPITSAFIFRAVTDKQGRYRFRLPPGETAFYVQSSPVGFPKWPSRNNLDFAVIPEALPVGKAAYDAPTLSVPLQKQER